MSTADPYAGSSRGPLDPVARPAGASLAGIALQAAATAATLAYLKLRYDTTLVNNNDASFVAAALLAAEALAAFRALCHLGPFNLRSREEYADTDALLAANSYNGCHMVSCGLIVAKKKGLSTPSAPPHANPLSPPPFIAHPHSLLL